MARAAAKRKRAGYMRDYRRRKALAAAGVQEAPDLFAGDAPPEPPPATKKKRDRAAYMRDYRARKRAEAEAAAAPPEAVGDDVPVEHTIAAVVRWSEERLRVPPGHPLAGQPMTLPDFGIAFLADALDAREALLCIARKNAKSALVAVYLLARLIGPLRRHGWRGAVCSVNKEKAGELKRQMEEIADASGLTGTTMGLEFLRTPAPGRVRSPWGTVDILSADKSSGHASGFDDAVIDETGLLTERDRSLVNGIRTSTSARDGRVLHLSIHGDGPFVPELLRRAGEDPDLAVHHYAAPEKAELDDEAGWRAANPGLGTIKSLAYMRKTARAALAIPADEPDFRAFDLNQPATPGANPIVGALQWQGCEVDDPADLAPRDGPCWIGLDLGGSASMTAGVLWWPATGRLEAYGAFPDKPMTLYERGLRDGVGNLYERMRDEGTLRTFSGRVTPVEDMLGWLADLTVGEEVEYLCSDRYRKDEVPDVLEKAGLADVWRVKLTPVGAGPDGGFDVRTFQRLVAIHAISALPTLLMRSAIRESRVVYKNGNPGLEKDHALGRIDPLQAAVLVVGRAAQHAISGGTRLERWIESAERNDAPLIMGI